MGRNDDGWSGDVGIDPATYETVSESSYPETILGTGGTLAREQDAIRSRENDE